jgi:hypothetical protein
MVFCVRHVCRLDPWPAEVREGFEWIERDPTVYVEERERYMRVVGEWLARHD